MENEVALPNDIKEEDLLNQKKNVDAPACIDKKTHESSDTTTHEIKDKTTHEIKDKTSTLEKNKDEPLESDIVPANNNSKEPATSQKKSGDAQDAPASIVKIYTDENVESDDKSTNNTTKEPIPEEQKKKKKRKRKKKPDDPDILDPNILYWSVGKNIKDEVMENEIDPAKSTTKEPLAGQVKKRDDAPASNDKTKLEKKKDNEAKRKNAPAKNTSKEAHLQRNPVAVDKGSPIVDKNVCANGHEL